MKSFDIVVSIFGENMGCFLMSFGSLLSHLIRPLRCSWLCGFKNLILMRKYVLEML